MRSAVERLARPALAGPRARKPLCRATPCEPIAHALPDPSARAICCVRAAATGTCARRGCTGPTGTQRRCSSARYQCAALSGVRTL